MEKGILDIMADMFDDIEQFVNEYYEHKSSNNE